jgi:23S rRNA pseudouridine955/2504/2580 synthase
VVGDSKYGDFPYNRIAQRQWGLRRMFLHSFRLSLPHPLLRKRLAFVAPLPAELAEALPRAGIQWKPAGM